jgi:hypothetical protein
MSLHQRVKSQQFEERLSGRNAITHYEVELRLQEVHKNLLISFYFLDAFHQPHFASGLLQKVTPHALEKKSKGPMVRRLRKLTFRLMAEAPAKLRASSWLRALASSPVIASTGPHFTCSEPVDGLTSLELTWPSG